MLEDRAEKREAVEREHGVRVTSLFFYYKPSRNGMPAGRPIKVFRRAWATGFKAAGVPNLLFHDLRRSSIRAMVRAGISERVAMAYNGHQTRSIFERYNVVSEGDLQEQAAKLQAFLGAHGAEEGPRRDEGGEAKSEGETAEDKAG